ncbi:DNA topoisomerase 3-alpha [Bienertia sinuspersici]
MASRRQTSYGSNSSSANSKGAVFCTCGGTTVVRTVKHGPNIGTKFYGCLLWLVSFVCTYNCKTKLKFLVCKLRVFFVCLNEIWGVFNRTLTVTS